MLNPRNTPYQERQAALALLARANLDELVHPISHYWADLEVRDLKPVETGLVMLRGRIGGDGTPFNFGEATATRAVVSLSGGETGFACVLGRDAMRARLAAIADALLQKPEERDAVKREVLDPIAKRLSMERIRSAAETAATKVDFFTLVRGEP